MFTALATMALMAVPAVVASLGSAVVVNSCSYDVYLDNTPSDDGVHTAVSETLSPGGTYEQEWTELTNLAGWSIKLSLSSTEWTTDIMQYEYTYQDDGIIWYDLSDVNGNPWNGNWEITAVSPSSTCSPLQQAYRYATDDAYGMQACADDSTITVTLCSGDSDSSSSDTSSVTSATSTTSAASSSVASSSAAQTTTFATSTVATVSVATTDSAGSSTTEVATATVTSVVTSTHWYQHQHTQYPRHAGHAARRHAHE